LGVGSSGNRSPYSYPYTNSYSYCNKHAYSYLYRYTYPNTDCNSYTYGYPSTYSNADADPDSYIYADHHSHCYYNSSANTRRSEGKKGKQRDRQQFHCTLDQCKWSDRLPVRCVHEQFV